MSYKWPIVKSRDQSCSPVVFSQIESKPSGSGPSVPWEPFQPDITGPGRILAAKGKQVTCSFRHRKFPDGDYHSGGPFYTARNHPRTPTKGIKIQSSTRKYYGPVVQPLNFGSGYVPPSVDKSNDDSHLDKYGAEAIAIVDPTNPNAEVGVALGEIFLDKRISLPGIQSWKRRTEVAKAAGSEYLSAQFGWLPLVEEIKNTIQSVQDGHTIMENYHSLDGQEVHREFEFEPIEKESISVVNSGTRCLYSSSTSVSAFNGTPVPQTRRTTSTTRRWFSGTFMHYPNKVYDGLLGKRIADKRGDIDKLFGITLTPETLWELAPWSWAIDWFSNIGDVISNFTAFEINGLVMKYGFIMEEISGRETLFMPATGLSGVTGAPPDVWNEYSVKRRKEANPFGFGIGWEGLSPTQLAITAALGITRLR